MGVILTEGLNAPAVAAATCHSISLLRVTQKENGTTDDGLRGLDVLLPEQELSIQVGQVDCVKVQERDMTKARQNEVLHYHSHTILARSICMI